MLTVSEAELVAVAKKVALPSTERRVLAAALHDPAIRRRLAEIQQEVARPTEANPVLLAAQRVLREQAQAKTAWWQPFWGELRQRLTLVPRPLQLPLLSPALAASPEGVLVQREVIEEQGVRVELHQLPGEPMRLRCLVAVMGSPKENITLVALVFQEAGGVPFVVTVPLSAEGHGLREWEVGGAAPEGFPTPTQPLSLIEIGLIAPS